MKEHSWLESPFDKIFDLKVTFKLAKWKSREASKRKQQI